MTDAERSIVADFGSGEFLLQRLVPPETPIFAYIGDYCALHLIVNDRVTTHPHSYRYDLRRFARLDVSDTPERQGGLTVGL